MRTWANREDLDEMYNAVFHHDLQCLLSKIDLQRKTYKIIIYLKIITGEPIYIYTIYHPMNLRKNPLVPKRLKGLY